MNRALFVGQVSDKWGAVLCQASRRDKWSDLEDKRSSPADVRVL